MEAEATLQLGIIVSYLVITVVIGLIAYRISEYSAEDYYLAGRTVGTLVLLFTVFATLLSAFTVFGGPNISFRSGPEWILIMGLYGRGLVRHSMVLHGIQTVVTWPHPQLRYPR